MFFSWQFFKWLVPLCVDVFFIVRAKEPPRLCDKAEQNQTAVTSLGSTVTFSACVVVAEIGGFGDEYVTFLNGSACSFYHNDTFVMSVTALSDTTYEVQLTRSGVRWVDFGTHSVTVRNKTTNFVALSVFLTLLQEENLISISLLPVTVTSVVAAAVILIAVFLRCKGDRCRMYRIHKEITINQRILRCLGRESNQPLDPPPINEDHYYATVNDVVNPDDVNDRPEREDVDVTRDVAETPEPTHDADSADLASSDYAGYITPLDVLDSCYITACDVRGRTAKPTKHMSLQKTQQGQTNPYSLECYESLESLCATRPKLADDFSHYCNCQFFQATAEPKLMGIRRLSDNQVTKKNFMDEDMSRKRCTVPKVFNDTPESKTSRPKCHMYVNIRGDLEKYLESFRNVNRFMDKKRTMKKVLDLNQK